MHDTSSREFPVRLVPGPRRLPDKSIEDGREMRLGLEPNRQPDLDQWHLARDKHVLGAFDPAPQHVFVWTQAGRGLSFTSLADDVAATKHVIELQPVPCIMVAHSYGASIVTEAGMDPNVVGLVYIAAHEPNAGESEGASGKRFPNETSKTNAIEKPRVASSSIQPTFPRTSPPTWRAGRPVAVLIEEAAQHAEDQQQAASAGLERLA